MYLCCRFKRSLQKKNMKLSRVTFHFLFMNTRFYLSAHKLPLCGLTMFKLQVCRNVDSLTHIFRRETLPLCCALYIPVVNKQQTSSFCVILNIIKNRSQAPTWSRELFASWHKPIKTGREGGCLNGDELARVPEMARFPEI